MRTGAASGYPGHFHEAAIYDSDEAFLQVAVPFVREGLDAGEPVSVAVGHHQADILREAIGSAVEALCFPIADVRYQRPSTTIQALHELLTAKMNAGAQQVRVLGGLPKRVTDRTWEWWARYEAAVNEIYDAFPLWTMCTYDSRWVSQDVLEDVRRTHRYVATPDGRHRANPDFQEPVDFLNRPAGGTDPIEATAPHADVVDPTLAGARSVARESALSSGCSATEVMTFVVAVNEAVTNAHDHGVSPVRLRTWTTPGRAVATINDQGTGPRDPLAGLIKTADSPTGGLGLWIAYETCSHVTLGTDTDGFTLRLVVGEPVLAA